MDKMPDKPLSITRLHTILSTFKETRSEQYGLQALGYFGSYANQKASKDSDVDIVFDTDNPNLLLTSLMKQDLEEELGRSVDVLRLHQAMDSRLKARIEKEAVYV